MISDAVDIGRIGQYLRNGERVRRILAGPREDLHFLDQLRRAALPLATDRWPTAAEPFPPFRRRDLPALRGRRIAVIASGGSGVTGSVLGVARALEEAGAEPVAYGVCSGSAMFGIPLAAGLSAQEVADATLALRPAEYVDIDYRALAELPVRLGRGWSGVVRGDRIEQVYRRILGDITLGELSTPVWFPLWNIEDNRVAYVGSATHPDLAAAHAVRMAVALPTAVQPTELDGGWWLDGGIVDILPSKPLLTGDVCDLAIVVNGFYGAGFTPEQEPHWRESVLSALRMASQTRLMQHVELARRAIADLRRTVPDVIELTPVAFGLVKGAGLYGEFIDNRRWAGYMADGYRAAHEALDGWEPARGRPASDAGVSRSRAPR